MRLLNPLSVAGGFWRKRGLIWQLVRRDVTGRYRGSMLGLLWSFLTPIFMLAVYTLVFSVVFQARWGQGMESKTQFAIVLFAGLIVYNLFAEMISRAPGLILSNVSYVKRVVFPLEILPVVAAGSAVFHAIVSLLVLAVFQWVVNLSVPATAVFLPLVLLPFLLMTLGVAWFLASLGVFIRDISQPIGVLVTALLFLSPILYPVSALPESMRFYVFLNPLTFIIEQMRDVLIWGRMPDWGGLAAYAAVSVFVAGLGLWWFQRTRKGFADVL